MAIIFDGDVSKALTRTTALFDYNAGFVFAFWIYVTTWPATSSSAMIIDIGRSGDQGHDMLMLYTDASNNQKFRIATSDGVTADNHAVSTNNFVINTWYYVVFSRTSTQSFLLTVNGSTEIEGFVGEDVSSRASPDYLVIGRMNEGPSLPLSARLGPMKLYGEFGFTAEWAALEGNTILPMYSVYAPYLMYGVYPMFPGATQRAMDYGPNLHSFTEVGTLTDGDPAPVSWGASVVTTPHIEPIVGTTAWGQSTGVTETNTRTYFSHWTGTGAISGTSDAEKIELEAGEYMESEVVNTGADDFVLLQNFYGSGDTVTIKYRHGASVTNCLAASWTTYAGSFTSLGYVQIRIESTL